MIRGPGRQRGVALLMMLAIVGLGASWLLVSQLNAETGGIEAVRKKRNAEVLMRAKQALIGYVAAQAAKSGENNPGAMPCPENPGDFNATNGNDGKVGSGCGVTTIGRFPWRTLGLEKLVDSSGEPLWYVVGPGWGVNSSSSNTVINSNSYGQLTVDGVPNAAVALIIAPGPAFSTQAATGCTATNQSRPDSGTPNIANYLECDNATAADNSFVTTGTGTTFNDQVLVITAADVLPAIEAAIAHRIENEIGRNIRVAYSDGLDSSGVDSLWTNTRVYPYPATFGNPSVSPYNALQGNSSLQGGLFPANHAFDGGCECDPLASAPCFCRVNSQGQRSLEPCAASGNPRCAPGFVTWLGSAGCGASACTAITRVSGVTPQDFSCTVSGTPSTLNCTVEASTSLFNVLSGVTGMTFYVDAAVANMGKALRKIESPTANSKAPQITGFDTTYSTSPAYAPFGYGFSSATMYSDGTATVRIHGRFAAGSGSILAALGSITCSIFGIPLCYRYSFAIPMAVIQDHPIVDPSNSSYNWFVRNKWHEVTYYAVASDLLPGAGGSCINNSSCLTVNEHKDASGAPDAGKQQAIMMISGRTLSGTTRPNGSLADWFEGANVDVTSPFEVRSTTLQVNQSFNDRIAVLGSN